MKIVCGIVHFILARIQMQYQIFVKRIKYGISLHLS